MRSWNGQIQAKSIRPSLVGKGGKCRIPKEERDRRTQEEIEKHRAWVDAHRDPRAGGEDE